MFDYAFALCADVAVGGAFIAGGTDGSLGGPHAVAADTWLARYDSAGNQTWARQFGANSGEEAKALCPDGAGGAFVAGYTDGSLGGPHAGGYTDAWLARYDSWGHQTWIRQFGTNVLFEYLQGGAIFATPFYNYAHITIVDDENNPGTVIISSPVEVLEDQGSAIVHATRINGTTGAISVLYGTVPGTAQPPGDYTTSSATLSWAAGEVGTKQAVIPIINDTVQEPLESFTVHFSVSSGTPQLPEADALVEITDDDDPGDISVSPATVSVSETATTLNLTVTRGTGTSGAVSVA